jgi:glycosyltransferase involved in cell wall biosynthesis
MNVHQRLILLKVLVTGSVNKIMRIVILAPSHRSFICKFLPNYKVTDLPEGYSGAPFIGSLINELLNREHEVIGITTSVAIGNNYTISMFTYGKFKWIVVPSRKHTMLFNGLQFGKMLDFYAVERKYLRKVIEMENPDFIHAHWSYEFAGALHKSKKPHLVTIHDNPYQVLKYMRNLYRFFRLLMSEWVLNDVVYASTVSPYMKKYAEKKCAFVKVIPNPTIISNTYKTVEKLVSLRISTMSSPKIMMIMNGWDSRKNGVAGLKAFFALKMKMPNATLHLFGHGTENGGAAYRDAQSLQLNNIFFNGPVDHASLLKHLESAHILIHPSLEESFGVVLIEAMAQAVPVIGGKDSGAVPWVLNNESLLVNVLNFKQIEDKLIELLNNHEFYKEVSLKCYKNTVERFSVNAVVNDYQNYYNEIIKKWQ